MIPSKESSGKKLISLTSICLSIITIHKRKKNQVTIEKVLHSVLSSDFKDGFEQVTFQLRNVLVSGFHEVDSHRRDVNVHNVLISILGHVLGHHYNIVNILDQIRFLVLIPISCKRPCMFFFYKVQHAIQKTF